MMKPPSPLLSLDGSLPISPLPPLGRKRRGPESSDPGRALAILLASFTMLGTMLGFTAWRGTAPETVPEPVDFSQFQVVEERKEAFFAFLLPLVRESNDAVRRARERLLRLESKPLIRLSWWDRRWLVQLAERYQVENFLLADPGSWAILKRRVDIVPASLSLAQAANESAWGTSRFALEGYNFFGHWCFVPGCGMVPARRDAGAGHEVAAFDSPRESVEKYIHNLNTHEAYLDLRITRESLRESELRVTGPSLVEGLGSYSERGSDYIAELQEMIEFNGLSRYDEALPES